MQLQLKEFEEKFKKYRENLRLEIHRFRDSASVYRQISERTVEHLDEINFAPGFFQTVEGALFTTIVLWADKLFDESGQRGFFNFLNFVEHNRKWLTVDELKLRRNYPDGHWMLQNRTPITRESIEIDRQKIRSLSALKSFAIRRDKFHGHFDKQYFFERSKLNADAPITWNELDASAEIMGAMLNEYSADFDGNLYSWHEPNDLSYLLTMAKKGYASI